MIYPINILQKTINEHRTSIKKLEAFDSASYGEYVWIEEEIKEREGYISELTYACEVLSKTPVVKKTN